MSKDDLPDGESEIFFEAALDIDKIKARDTRGDLPVGQNDAAIKPSNSLQSSRARGKTL
jgi:hypothetical protein